MNKESWLCQLSEKMSWRDIKYLPSVKVTWIGWIIYQMCHTDDLWSWKCPSKSLILIHLIIFSFNIKAYEQKWVCPHDIWCCHHIKDGSVGLYHMFIGKQSKMLFPKKKVPLRVWAAALHKLSAEKNQRHVGSLGREFSQRWRNALGGTAAHGRGNNSVA